MTTDTRHPKAIHEAGQRGWVVHCRRCGKGATKHFFDTKKECHEWYKQHARLASHRDFLTWKDRQEREAQADALARLLGIS